MRFSWLMRAPNAGEGMGQTPAREALTMAIPLLTIAYGFLAVANFSLNTIVGRVSGAAALGAFALAISVGRIMYALADLGLASHLIRSVAREPDAAGDVLSRFVSLRVLSIPVVILAAAIAGYFFAEDEIGVFCAAALALGFIQIQALYENLMLAVERRRATALLSVFSSFCVIAGCAIWWEKRGTLFEYSAIYGLTTLAGMAVAIAWAGARLGIWPRATLQAPILKADILASWPLGASVVLSMVALRCPQLILGAFGSPADVGPLAAADMFVTATAILQTVVSNATYSRLASSVRRDPDAFRRVYWASTGTLAVLGVAAGAFFALFGAEILSWVFPSKDFTVVRGLIQIVGWSTPALLIVQHHLMVFAASDGERTGLIFMTLWLLGIVVLQLALVPMFGLIGAAWGLFIGRTLGVVVLIAVLRLSPLRVSL